MAFPPTPHISAKKGDIAKIVLMPGDPLRAKWAAEKFLKDVKLVSSVRGMLFYTGTYKGKPVSIAGSGMGMSSIGIYSYELFHFYDVDVVIRVGSTGALKPEINIYDVICVKEACAEAPTFHQIVNGSSEKLLKADPEIVKKLEDSAKNLGIPLLTAKCFSAEVFWAGRNAQQVVDISGGADCIEMESYALFANAIKTGKRAGTILTVVDSLVTWEEIPSDAREKTLDKMFEIALGIL